MDNKQQQTDAYKNLYEQVKKSHAKFIDLNFTDIFGTLKSVTIPAKRIEDVINKNKWFDGSSIQGFARIAESDQYLVPDPTTFAMWPQQSDEHIKTARIICDVHNPDCSLFEGAPRNVLKRAVAAAKQTGLEFMLCPEVEFFFYERTKDMPNQSGFDVGGYFDCATSDPSSEVKKKIMNAMEDMDIPVEMAHHEVAPGQQEIGFEYGPATLTADRTITMKHLVKSIAQANGLNATFMPKPLFGQNGSGMHIHISAFDTNNNNKNAFYDEHSSDGLSDIAKYAIGGIFDNIKPMTAVLNPIVNSYKRLTPGYEAPVYVCWGHNNRSALIRVPRINNDSNVSESATRFELRSPDPSCNTYLGFAAIIMAALDGIERKVNPPEPVGDDVYISSEEELAKRDIKILPYSLMDSLKDLQSSSLMKKTLGDHLFKAYLTAKWKEWDRFRVDVTDWERAEYLERV